MVIVTTGFQRGFTGRFFSLIPASSGVRPLFLVVATPAGRHDIFPRLFPAFGDGNDVVERQFLGPEFVMTVLAGVAISRKDIDAGKLDCAVDCL